MHPQAAPQLAKGTDLVTPNSVATVQLVEVMQLGGVAPGQAPLVHYETEEHRRQEEMRHFRCLCPHGYTGKGIAIEAK